MLPEVIGELRAGAEPELRFAPSGVPVCKIRAVASSRKQVDGAWQDDKTVWLNVLLFNRPAENAAESIRKGDLFVVKGKLQVDEWTDREGGKRTNVEVVADWIGPSLSRKAATVIDAGPSAAPQQTQPRPEDDPWTSDGGNASDDPPF